VRWIGTIGLIGVLAAVSADAKDAKRVCPDVIADINGLTEETDPVEASPFLKPLLLTENECEALKNRELRIPLLAIPQEEEDPIALSLGSRGDDATFRVKIPFSLYACEAEVGVGRCRADAKTPWQPPQ
jgi:hypothetical protein